MEATAARDIDRSIDRYDALPSLNFDFGLHVAPSEPTNQL
jgi:hypothetical protein